MDVHVRVIGQEAVHALGLVTADVVADDMDLALLGWLTTMLVRKATNCSLVWRGTVLPSTSPVAVLSAANRLSVPLRSYSKPWLSARPGDSATTKSFSPPM